MKPQITELKASGATRPAFSGALACLAALACLGNSPLLADNIVTATPPSAVHTTLRLFLDMAARDPVVTSLLGKHKLLLQYSIRDLRLECYVGSDGKRAVAAFGRPARKAEVVFVSDAGALDSLLRDVGGEADTQMTVDLNIVRKIKLLKDLKPIRAALARVYKAACERVNTEAAGKTLAAR